MTIEPDLGGFWVEIGLSAEGMLQDRNLGLLFLSLWRKRKQREMCAEMMKADF